MTTEIDPEQASRVARLAQRRAASGGGRAAVPPSAPQPAPLAAPSPAMSTVAAPPAWEPPAQYRPVRYTQPIAITVARATEAAAASASASTVPMNAAARSAHLAATAPEVAVVDRATSLPVMRSRRRHAAAAGRVIATGLATSGFLATVTALAQADARAEQAATPAPDSTAVTVIEKTIYVDENGNPIAPPASLATAAADPAVTDTVLPGETTVPTATVAGQLPVTTVAGQPLPVPAPAPAPSGGGGGGGTPAPAPVTTAKAVAPAPAPVTTTKAPTPVTTAPPAPVTTKPPATTQPPAPATTQPPPPPATTAPPACTGSQC